MFYSCSNQYDGPSSISSDRSETSLSGGISNSQTLRMDEARCQDLVSKTQRHVDCKDGFLQLHASPSIVVLITGNFGAARCVQCCQTNCARRAGGVGGVAKPEQYYTV